MYPEYVVENGRHISTGFGMYPEYVVENGRHISTGFGMRIEWQEGPFMTASKNGAMLELPVRALIHRVEDLHRTLPCEQNFEIIQHLNMVLRLLDDRTRERNRRGVLGTVNA
jgi:hypothetical protein